MTLTITLAPETEEKLRRRAADRGQTLEAFLQQLVEGAAQCDGAGPEQAPSKARTFDDILAPVRKGFEQSGLSEDELSALFEEAREEAWQERQREKGPS
jgi:hypothetical protein